MDLLKPSYASGYAKNASQSANPNLWDGLVGAWMPSLGVTGGTLRDVSGNENHGTLQYDTSWKTNNSETSLYFDGVQDHVSGFGDVSLSTTEPFSIVSKVRLNSFLDANPNICQIKTNTSYAFIVACHNSNVNYKGIFFGSTDSWVRLRTGTNFATNITQSLVILYNGNGAGTASNFSMYLDGKQINLSSAGRFIGITQNNYLGTANAGSRGTDDWHGNINSFSIYNRALSPQEIKQLYVDSLAPFRTKKRTVVRVPAAIPTATKVGSIKKPTTIIKPSYQAGYARNASESENPKLWDGLVGAWMPSLGVTGDALRDVSGNGNHGTLTNTNWEVSSARKSVVYNGSTSKADIQSNKKFELQEMSACIWFKINSVNLSNYTHIFWKKKTGSPFSSFGLWIEQYTRNIFGGFGQFHESTGSQLPLNEWVFASLTYDGYFRRIFLNGLLDVEASDSSLTIQYDSNPIQIGFGDYNLEFNGAVSSASIYNRALSPTEIKQLYVDSLAPFRKKQRVSVAVPGAVAPTTAYHPLRSLAHPLEQ